MSNHNHGDTCCHGHEKDPATPEKNTSSLPDSKKRSFRISGMDCIEEVTALKSAVGSLVGGVDNLSFDILNGRMGVLNDTIADKDIITAVGRTGMRAELIDANIAQSPTTYRKSATILTAVSGFLLLSGFLFDVWSKGGFLSALQEGGQLPILTIMLYVSAIVAGGWFVAPKAFFSLKRFRPDMNLLMVVAVAGAAGIGEWFEAATVTFLFSLSLALEAWSIARARRAVAALMSLAPEVARIKQKDGAENEVSSARVPIGSLIIVIGGERIPLDGTFVTR